MALDPNQFTLSPVKGQMDLHQNINVISAQLDSTSAGGLVAGQPVKLVANNNGGVPKVVECAADSDDIFGFIVYDIKNKLYNAGDVCELAAMHDSIMYMEADSAITQGADVAIVLSGVKVEPAAMGQRIVGQAFDGAAAGGKLIRVKINLPGAIA